MLCYKDMTFCTFSDCEHFATCARAFTPEVKEKAVKSGLGICQFVHTPDCFKEKHAD